MQAMAEGVDIAEGRTLDGYACEHFQRLYAGPGLRAGGNYAGYKPEFFYFPPTCFRGRIAYLWNWPVPPEMVEAAST